MNNAMAVGKRDSTRNGFCSISELVSCWEQFCLLHLICLDVCDNVTLFVSYSVCGSYLNNHKARDKSCNLDFLRGCRPVLAGQRKEVRHFFPPRVIFYYL